MKLALAWTVGVIALLLIAASALLYTPDTDKQAMFVEYGAPPSRFVNLGALTVHYRDEGPRDAPVIVLLHGSNSDLHTWDPWTKRLTAKYRVIRFDQIGHGLTGPSPTRDYRASAFVETVDRLTTQLGVKRFVLAGSSMGGWVAWEYARRHPGRLNGLVLIDAAGAPEDPNKQLPIGFRIARTPVLSNLMLWFTPRAVVAKSVHQTVSNQAVATPATIDRYWELLRYPGNRQATIDRFATPRVQVPRDQVACIATRTLILWGAEDKLIPVASAQWFKAALGNSQLIVYPGVGHLPMEEVADRSESDLEGWLAGLPRLD
ncbi:Alpha/beta hydrolase [Sphingomonas antarctica]|uniref:alpha/beta fold hydrolase n=1 Tax=Sphingomonas antarctica TaxID=2040274 RepID=UPI0039E918CF